MQSAIGRWGSAVVLSVCASFGCQSTSNYSACENGNGACGAESGACGDGCKEGCGHGPKRWSAEWYAARNVPEGTRQKFHVGKAWPPYARPTGKHQQFSARFHDVHYWPYPYNCQDRGYLHSVSNLQASNGWTEGTTLYDYHFEQEKAGLNHAGRLHLKWVLQTVPESRRHIWVQRTDDRDSSQTRLENVKLAAAEMLGDEKLPPIELRMTSPTGRPSIEIDQIRTLELGTIPAPRLSAIGGGSMSGGGDSGGGEGGM